MLSDENPFTKLREQQDLREQDFESSVPVVGPLIVWFRTQWLNVAARWYVRPLVQQQNAFNRQLVNTVERTVTGLREQLALLEEHVSALEQNVAGLDVDQVALAKDLAEARYQIIRTRRDLDSVHPSEAIGQQDKTKAPC